MPQEIFDQHRPRSTKARRLDEAFAGCEEWTLAPPSPRRNSLEVAPWLSSQRQPAERAAYDGFEERRAA
jgi:hypothetical protein